MSSIRMQDVSRAFAKPSASGVTEVLIQSIVPGGAGPTPSVGSDVDRGFEERVEQQHLRETVGRAEHAGKVTALDHVNLTIPDGQTMSIIGPSGCGKSTLLRVVAGLDPFTGRVLYDDQDMAPVPTKDRGIGMVFQSYALYPQLESRGNLSFFFKMHKKPDAETEERIRVTSEIMGIGFKELLARKPRLLSGGQQQRVAIARAIVRKPRLFLFDEPLSNLDAKLRAQTRIEIKRLFDRFRITAVYVTHDQSEAIMLGDQIAVMRAGKIEQVGSYRELIREPNNAFVAGFLGVLPMNLLGGGVVRGGMLRIDTLEIPLPDTVRRRTHTGHELTLGVRPEAARIVQEDRATPRGIRISGLVESLQPDFEHDTQLAHVRTGALSYIATTSIDTALQVGEACQIIFPTDRLHFFDGTTEQRLG